MLACSSYLDTIVAVDVLDIFLLMKVINIRKAVLLKVVLKLPRGPLRHGGEDKFLERLARKGTSWKRFLK